MARNPYTKDITKSSIYKKVTGQEDKPLIDQALEFAAEIKNFGSDKVEENMQILRDEKIFDIQNSKNKLNNLNQFALIEQDINQNYNGSVEDWSLDKAKELITQKVLQKYPYSDITKENLTVKLPDEAYGEPIKQQAKAIENNYLSISSDLNNLGVPYKDLNKGEAFIDEAYENVFNQIGNINKFNTFAGIKGLFTGQGLNYASAADLRKSYGRNVANSKLSEIKKIDTQLKGLFALYPEFAANLKEALPKARFNLENKISDIKTEEQINEDTGQKRIVRYQNQIISYEDANGNYQVEEKRVELPDGYVPKSRVIPEEMVVYGRLLDEAANDEFNKLILEDGNTPETAYRKLAPRFGKSLNQVEKEDLIAANKTELAEMYFEYAENNFYIMGPMGESTGTYKPEVQAFLDGKGPKPAYYKSFDDFIDGIYKFRNRLSPSSKITNNIYKVDYALSNSPRWKDFFDSLQGQNVMRELKEMSIPSLTLENQLKEEFESGDFSRVDSLGNYFPPEEKALDMSVLETLQLGTLFDSPQRVGYNVKEDRVIFKDTRYSTMDMEIISADNKDDIPQEENRVIERRFNLAKPFGFVKDLLIGEDLGIEDALWLVPGLGLVRLGAVASTRLLASKGAAKVLEKAKSTGMYDDIVQRTKITKTVKVKQTKGDKRRVKRDKQGRPITKKEPVGNFGFGKDTKAYDNWFNSLNPTQKALVNSMNPRTGALDEGKFAKEFVEIKGLQISGKIPQVSNRYLKWGAPIAGQTLERTDLGEQLVDAAFFEDVEVPQD